MENIKSNTERSGAVVPEGSRMSSLEEQYLNSISAKEMKAYLIAKNHLGMSFQLDKSVGFIKWKKEQTK